jgi:hypothetical protein
MTRRFFKVKASWTVESFIYIKAESEEEAFANAQDVPFELFEDSSSVKIYSFEMDPYSVRQVGNLEADS